VGRARPGRRRGRLGQKPRPGLVGLVRLARSGLYGSNSEILREALRGLMERERRLALADPPKAYPLVRRYERFGIRRCVHGDHLIFYRLQPEQIEVIHVLQGARDIEALLFGSP